MSRASNRPPVFYLALGVVTTLMAVVVLWMIFVHAPIEARMGIVQKIFYFHVPSAYAMYVGFGVCGAASIGYLTRRSERWDAIAVSGAEVGLTFCLIVLLTGPIWARKAWGVWWTWDPRLTTTLLAGMIFTAYVVLRSFGTAGPAEKRFAAALAIIGLIDLPVIHYSVQRWSGTHPTVITSKGGGLTPEMGQTLGVSMLFFTLLVAWLIWTRVRHERARQALVALELFAAERGLLEDA